MNKKGENYQLDYGKPLSKQDTDITANQLRFALQDRSDRIQLCKGNSTHHEAPLLDSDIIAERHLYNKGQIHCLGNLVSVCEQSLVSGILLRYSDGYYHCSFQQLQLLAEQS